MTAFISNPAKLPGAFLFLTVKTAGGAAGPAGTHTSVAYDPTVIKGTTLEQLSKNYTASELPYIETFGDVKSWDTSNKAFYSGIFGGPNGHVSRYSPSWSLGGPIGNGVYITYWNLPGGSSGVHTSSILQPFQQPTPAPPQMQLYKGSTTNLVSKAIKGAVTELTIDYYATHSDVGELKPK
ncbi:MAG: hypothetical protein M1822_006435 [Bathelium mastoideum]|nr:MAG: hypothetical protein M1822_006435 [Bathelium mastoideum]